MQVVLEVLEVNVKVGSCVYEQGHTVLLCWCESAGETEQVRLGSRCAGKGGSTRGGMHYRAVPSNLHSLSLNRWVGFKVLKYSSNVLRSCRSPPLTCRL